MAGRPAIDPAPGGRKFIAVRLAAWSEWDRQVIRGVQRFAHERSNWRLYVESGQSGATRLTRADVSLDGLITTRLRDPSAAWQRLLLRMQQRVVALSSAIPASLSSIPRVQVDDSRVAATIGAHLLAGGFRRFAYSGFPRPGVRDTRMEALVAFAQTEGHPCNLIPVSRAAVEPSAAMLLRWLRALPKPVGVVAWNMAEARSLLDVCVRAKLQVPEQVAVVAWDDDPMLAETLEPTISAAVMPAERLGFEAARLLDLLLSGAPIPDRPVIIEPTGIVHVRQSSDVSTLEDRDTFLALQYIREHAAEPIKVSHIVGALGVSRRRLENQFQRVTKQTIYEAIIKVRMEKARQLLTETDWPLAKVAESSGIGTQETLRRLFLEHEGITPGAFRERFGGP